MSNADPAIYQTMLLEQVLMCSIEERELDHPSLRIQDEKNCPVSPLLRVSVPHSVGPVPTSYDNFHREKNLLMHSRELKSACS